ncbi:thioredoxin domain-containing protein [Pigmentiphaga aceris]|uniref:Thioredoxin domain-containing protein n=1 Tax=Pigmentiphaga aceris TaxID=1940612 RepID=A0A5C0B176_9BURK|nr:thioredoxin domain-containing protein [Pigmentiphaga aceris]QEI08509.1 thioredoxin domain-containing protein [Pigmentiphaga aceris]
MTRKKTVFILAGAVVLLAFILGVFTYQRQQAKAQQQLAQQNSPVFNRSHSPTYGPSTAKVKITEFFDPACETCRAFYPMVKKLVDAEKGRVQLVVRFVPFHHGSELAAKILVAAQAQNLFIPVTEIVLNNQDAWASHSRPEPERIWGFLKGTSFDLAKARVDVDAPAVKAVIDQDMADAKTLNVTRTPGFFVNGKPLVNFGYAQLEELVQQELRLAYPD